MKAPRIALIAMLVLVLLLASRAFAQGDPQRGELHIYEHATQAGTVADREFKDSKGRIVRNIIYTGGGTAPYREDLLQVYLINAVQYDAADCAVKAATFWPDMRLKSTVESTCWPGTAAPKLTIFRDARGVRTQETRHKTEGGKQTVLLFDAKGEKVVAIKGLTPEDIDLAHSWGQEVAGFACGIAPNLERGRQEDVDVFVTVKNIRFRPDRTARFSPLAIELKDSAGKLVGPKPEFAAAESKIATSTCPAFSVGPNVGESNLLTQIHLAGRYDRLAPGKYEMTVKLCSKEFSGALVSNTLSLEIGTSR